MAVRPLKATFVERVWGARNLDPYFVNPTDKKIGEVWLTADPPLPLLFKFIFTTEKLSVQVHPGGDTGKTEMWHILETKPGASIAAGFQQKISPEHARAAALDGSIESLLRWIPVQAGDSIFIPAGTVHAIGAPLTLFEVQQNSDITYRLYDYGRPRELHLDQGLSVAHLHPHSGLDSKNGEVIAECEYFIVERISVKQSRKLQDAAVTVLEGTGSLDGQKLSRGMAYQIEGEATLEGDVEAIVARVP